MYKQTAALALLVAAACAGSNAQAADVTGWFINGGVGSAHYHASFEDIDLGRESDTAFQVTAGWRSQFIGFEGGYVDLGGVSANDGIGDSARVSGKGWTAGLNGHFNPTERWYISARAGFFLWTVDARADIADESGSTRYSGSTRGTNGYAGLGTGVDIDRHWSVGVNFDYYKLNKQHVNVDTKTYSVTAEYRF